MFRPRGMMGRRRGRGNNGYLMFMLLQLGAQVQRLERKPPVTLALMGLMIMLYLQPGGGGGGAPGGLVSEICLRPDLVLRDTDLFRLLGSAFVHAGDMHLYYNMSSLLWKGVQIELVSGSAAFASMVGALLVLSHALFVALGVLLGPATGIYPAAFSTCAVGFSAVLFALKVVLNDGSPTHTYVFGMAVPTKYAAWAELVVASLISPRASFVGHLAGILAGYLWVRGGVGRLVGRLAAGAGRGGDDARRWYAPNSVGGGVAGLFVGLGDFFNNFTGGGGGGGGGGGNDARTYGRGTTGHTTTTGTTTTTNNPAPSAPPSSAAASRGNNDDDDARLQEALRASREAFDRDAQRRRAQQEDEERALRERAAGGRSVRRRRSSTPTARRADIPEPTQAPPPLPPQQPPASEAPGAATKTLSADELRRRRMARFG